ncbi:SRPBCC family protein [Kytococcus schroeteri]|uniref:SRPBCC family protein n=1 Tax=Kytococcus schroeteri TaxID=138300 RepID=UPI0015DE620A|nr:SRPBCC family protein [Kytococcus schroeteri]
MKSFEVERFASAPVEAVWPLLTEFAPRSAYTPYKVTTTAPGPVGIGWTFEARTPVGLGSARDEFKVTRWTPPTGGPAAFSLRRVGSRVAGWCDVTMTPHPRGCRISWRESVRPSGMGGDGAAERAVNKAVKRAIEAAEASSRRA